MIIVCTQALVRTYARNLFNYKFQKVNSYSISGRAQIAQIGQISNVYMAFGFISCPRPNCSQNIIMQKVQAYTVVLLCFTRFESGTIEMILLNIYIKTTSFCKSNYTKPNKSITSVEAKNSTLAS